MLFLVEWLLEVCREFIYLCLYLDSLIIWDLIKIILLMFYIFVLTIDNLINTF